MAIEIMDDKRKRTIGIYSFLPLVALIIATAYQLLVFRDELAARDMEDHIALSTETFRNWTPLLIAYGLAGAITLAVLLYFIIHTGCSSSDCSKPSVASMATLLS